VGQLELIATDGITQKRIQWVDVKQNGVYTGWIGIGDNHISYHSDGNVFWTINNETRKTASFQPLKKFIGMHQICSFVFSSDITKLKSIEYKMKKLRYIVYIDVRKYRIEKFDIGCNVCILEPNRFELLEQTVDIPITEIHLFPESYPWILIIIYKAATDRYD
jgi:hypothetical protein